MMSRLDNTIISQYSALPRNILHCKSERAVAPRAAAGQKVTTKLARNVLFKVFLTNGSRRSTLFPT